MVILSTPFDDLRKELLAKPKGHPITDVLNKGREYEAIQASQASLKTLGAAATTNIDAVYKGRPCNNCGLHHARSKCPASEAVCGGCAAPPALQRMLLKIPGYDFNLVYRPGPEMVLSDTLSRLPNQANNHAIDLDDIGINQVELDHHRRNHSCCHPESQWRTSSWTSVG